MARTRQPSRRPTNISTYERNFKIWLQRCKQMQKCSINVKDYIRKLLIYYPKDPQALKLLTLQIHNETNYNKVPEVETEPIPEIRRLFTKIASRYKRDLLQHQNLNVCWDKFPIWQTCRTSRFFKFSQTDSTDMDLSSVIKKTVKTNKHVKAIQFGKNLTCSEDIVSKLRYIRSLESIYFSFIPSMPMHIFQKGLFTSSLALQNVTLKGEFDTNLDPEEKATSDIVQLMKVILKLPNLKSLNFDTDSSDKIDLNKIPFSILKKKDINYNIRFVNSQDAFELLPATESGLDSVKFLGINAMESWLENEPRWTFFEEEHLKAQDTAQKVLLISLFKMKKVDLSLLIPTCRNITTLSISLSIRDIIKRLSFVSLKYLENLEHLFLVVDNLREYPLQPWPRNLPKCCSSNLFNNLRFCAGKLKSVSIQLAGNIPQKTHSKILTFFKACSETLTHFTLTWICHGTSVHAAEIFCKGILLLKKLESLKLIYEPVGYPLLLGQHPQFEGLEQCQSLKELVISSGCSYFDQVKIPNLENLEKLHIKVGKLEEDTLPQLPNLIRLKHLEFYFKEINSELWTKLLKTINRLPGLETLKLHCVSTRDPKTLNDALADLKILKELHSNLACIAYGTSFIRSDTVYLFGKSSSGWKREVDGFFWRDYKGMPKQRIYKVYA